MRFCATWRRWLVILVCLFLAGCSTTRFAYNQLDWILVWYIGGYFSLDDEQEEELAKIVRRNIEWHRHEQLPEYVQLLRELQEQNASKLLDQQRLDYFYAEFIRLWDEFIVHVTPEVTTFLALLSQEQLDEFIENLEESNQELWDEYAGTTLEERQKKRSKAAIKGIERFYGGLNRDQKALVRTSMAGLHDISEEWMAGRRLWQQEFRNLLAAPPPEPAFTEQMLNLMLDPNQFDTREYRDLVDENRRLMQQMTVDLNETLTERQRKKFDKRVAKFIKNFEILAAQ